MWTVAGSILLAVRCFASSGWRILVHVPGGTVVSTITREFSLMWLPMVAAAFLKGAKSTSGLPVPMPFTSRFTLMSRMSADSMALLSEVAFKLFLCLASSAFSSILPSMVLKGNFPALMASILFLPSSVSRSRPVTLKRGSPLRFFASATAMAIAAPTNPSP